MKTTPAKLIWSTLAIMAISITFYMAGKSDGKIQRAKEESAKIYYITLFDLNTNTITKARFNVKALEKGVSVVYSDSNNIDSGVLIKGVNLSDK